MKKWRVGYLPLDGGGDRRGWSLRGHAPVAIGGVGKLPRVVERVAHLQCGECFVPAKLGEANVIGERHGVKFQRAECGANEIEASVGFLRGAFGDRGGHT
jgi:hypothetical protein